MTGYARRRVCHLLISVLGDAAIPRIRVLFFCYVAVLVIYDKY